MRVLQSLCLGIGLTGLLTLTLAKGQSIPIANVQRTEQINAALPEGRTRDTIKNQHASHQALRRSRFEKSDQALAVRLSAGFIGFRTEADFREFG